MRSIVDGQRGTSTLEVIAALILFSLAAAGLAVVLPMAYGRASIWRDQYNVGRHLEQHLEMLRGQSFTGVALGEQTVTEAGLSCRTQTSYVKEAGDGKSWSVPGPGSGDGLYATYFDNVDFTGKRYSRIDPTINFGWGNGTPVTGIDKDSFSVRWTGWVEPPTSGNYTFITNTDDGARLWLNEQLIIDRWNSSGSYSSPSIALNANQKYTIKMEFCEKNGNAKAYLSWTYPGKNQEIIPRQYLYSSLAKLSTVSVTNANGSVAETGKLLTFHNNLATNTNKIIYVADINMSRWLFIFVRVNITVYDESNRPLSGVTVNGQVDFHSILGSWNQSVSGVTGSNGVAVIDVIALASSATFTVTNLTREDGGYIYDPTRNRESEESI